MALNCSRFRISAINTNSLITNQRRYSLIKYTRTHNPDIVLLSETKLNRSHNLEFKDYHFLRQDRPNSIQGGGTAILIKKSIPFEQKKFKRRSSESGIETCAIVIKGENNQRLYIISMYAPQGDFSFIHDLDSLFHQLETSNLNNYYIIAGDLNARLQEWGDRNSNQRGTYLKNYLNGKIIEHRPRVYVPADATHAVHGTFLDLCIADARLDFSELSNGKLVTRSYDSDHRAIAFTVNFEANSRAMIDDLQQKNSYNYKKTRWKKFNNRLLSHDLEIPSDRNLSNTEIDDAVSKITLAINDAITHTVAKYKSTDCTEKYITGKIKNLQKQKTTLLSRLHRLNNYLNPNLATSQQAISDCKRELNDVKYALKKEFSSSSNKYWANKAEKLNYKESSTFFPNINKIFRPREQNNIDTLKIDDSDTELINKLNISETNTLKVDNTFLINDNTMILNVLGTHYERVNQAPAEPGHKELHSLVTDNAKKLRDDIKHRHDTNQTITKFSTTNPAYNPSSDINNRNPFTSAKCLQKTRSTLNNKTSSGPDGIPNVVLKNIDDKFILTISTVFKNIINNSYCNVIDGRGN